MIYVKVHDSENGSIMAMCDEKLIGSVLEEGDTYIDIKGYSGFYNGRLMDREGALKLISGTKDLYSANVVGSEAVAIALDARIIDKPSVKSVKGVPYAHAYRII